MRFAKFTALIATVALTAAIASDNARGATVRAHGYVLQLNGAPFVIKGMNYSPVPIGAAPAIGLMATTSFPITPTSGGQISTKSARQASTSSNYTPVIPI